jgi:transcriptional regulator GlxA family with amidase domain
MDRSLTVAILVFREVEVLDFAGPFEVFSVASRVAHRDGDHAFAPFAPLLVSKSGGMVRARHGLDIVANASFGEVTTPDVLIVPGGVVTKPLGDDDTRDWIVRAHQTSLVTASVCTGALLLAKAGLLDGLAATTHWEDLDALKALAPKTDVRSDQPYLDQGRIVTSGGISAGIDMSLHLVGRMTTPDLAIRTARQMEYRWEPGGEG